MDSIPRAAAAAAAILMLAAPAAQACVAVGAYADDPVRTLPALRAATGHRITLLSVYVSGTGKVPSADVRLARRRHLRLVVTWEPSRPHVLAAVRRGRFDKALRRLATQLAAISPAPVLRPMPEMNVNWNEWAPAWDGSPASAYITAWRHVRSAVRHRAPRVRLLWAPYARSVPDTDANQIGQFWPGESRVDLVGTSGYNFGTGGGLAWSSPDEIFGDAYSAIEDLGAKPFWIAETASTSIGGDKAAWIDALAAEAGAMPELRAIVWYQARDENGDWRATQTAATTAAFRRLVSRACR
jgi:hypothetical protein